MKKFLYFFLNLGRNYPIISFIIILLILLCLYPRSVFYRFVDYLDTYFTPNGVVWLQFCEKGPKIFPDTWENFSYDQKRFAFYYEQIYYKFLTFCIFVCPLSFLISLCYALDFPIWARIVLPLKKIFKFF
jgi:hypothetical protein